MQTCDLSPINLDRQNQRRQWTPGSTTWCCLAGKIDLIFGVSPSVSNLNSRLRQWTPISDSGPRGPLPSPISMVQALPFKSNDPFFGKANVLYPLLILFILVLFRKINKMSGEENDKVNVQAYGILMMAMTALGAIINITSIIILSRRDTPSMFHTSLKVRAFK